MDVILLVKGILAGITIAAPVGPVGVFCIERALSRGFAAGAIAGVGAAAADTMFGVLAAFGLTFIAEFLLRHEVYMRLIGGGFMLLMGLRILMKKVQERAEAKADVRTAAQDIFTTFVLTITNPITILSFSPAFLAYGAVVPQGDVPRAWTLIAGVFIGSLLWFTFLSALATLFRKRLTGRALTIINIVSGSLVLLFGLLVLFSVTEWGNRLIGGGSL
jgi:threonine/homoserine/homoserine lactone efflux protein